MERRRIKGFPAKNGGLSLSLKEIQFLDDVVTELRSKGWKGTRSQIIRESLNRTFGPAFEELSERELTIERTPDTGRNLQGVPEPNPVGSAGRPQD